MMRVTEMRVMSSLYITATITLLLALLGHDPGSTLVHGGSSSGSGSGSGGSSGHHFPTVHGGGTITYTLGPTQSTFTSSPGPPGSTSYSSPPSWTPWDGNARRHKGNVTHGSGSGSSGTSSMSPPTAPRPPKPTGFTPPSVVQSNLSIFQMIVFAWIASCLALLTVLGNILVMVSFKIDKQLQTISNYFLFSLAMADFCVGLISMPLFTIHVIMGYWPFGPAVCDTWLAMDYLVSNASVLNLLIISFDRYFSVTRPLTYRARRTTRRAAVMISSAWGISLVLWPPWIYAWPYIEGKRTVPEGKCYIQFIETNHYITFGTAIAAFYVPVSIMLWLYWKIWRETEKRQRDLSQLQAGKKESSRRSNSSDEVVDVEEWKRMRSESCICPDHLDQLSTCPAHQSQSKLPRWCSNRLRCLTTLWYYCTTYCRVDRDPDDDPEVEDEHVSPGCGTPASVETPLQSSVSRCTSLNVIRDPLALTSSGVGTAQTQTRRTDVLVSSGVHLTHPATITTANSHSEGTNGKLPGSDSVYTILIRIPGEMENKNASIRMIQEPGPLPPLPAHAKAKLVSSNPSEYSYSNRQIGAAGIGGGIPAGHTNSADGAGGLARRQSAALPPLNAKVIPKPLTSKTSAGTISSTSTNPSSVQAQLISQQPPKSKKKRKNQEKKQEKKAAKTLSAILLTFIVTWTPYNILVLLRTVLEDEAIPELAWNIVYYLCYINSTINPMCYALCNASFRRTYVRILTCKWDNSKRQAVNRGFYN